MRRNRSISVVLILAVCSIGALLAIGIRAKSLKELTLDVGERTLKINGGMLTHSNRPMSDFVVAFKSNPGVRIKAGDLTWSGTGARLKSLDLMFKCTSGVEVADQCDQLNSVFHFHSVGRAFSDSTDILRGKIHVYRIGESVQSIGRIDGAINGELTISPCGNGKWAVLLTLTWPESPNQSGR